MSTLFLIFLVSMIIVTLAVLAVAVMGAVVAQNQKKKDRQLFESLQGKSREQMQEITAKWIHPS
jgi:hypothetical protein